MADREVTDELPEWVKPGVIYRTDFGPDNRNSGEVFHVRGIVDGRAVVRQWLRRKQRWNYTVVSGVEFQVFGDHYRPDAKTQTPNG